MAQHEFAFVLTDKPEGKLQESWAIWRYENIANANNIVVKSIAAALKIIRATVKPNDVVSDIRLFSHGSTSGALQCRLKDNETLRYVLPAEAEKFAQQSPDVKAIAKLANADTGIHLLACNVAKSTASLGAWIKVFSGGKGWACGPNGWLHLGVDAIAPSVPISGKGKACPFKVFTIAPQPQTQIPITAFPPIDLFIDNTSVQQPRCIHPKQAGPFKSQYRKNVFQKYQDFFLKRARIELGAEMLSSLNGQPAIAVEQSLWAHWDLPKFGKLELKSRTIKLSNKRKKLPAQIFDFSNGGGIIYPLVASELLSMKELTIIIQGQMPKNRPKLVVIKPKDTNWSSAFIASQNAPANRNC